MGKFLEHFNQSSNLKAFFWNDVFEDYNPGFVVVFAHNEEEAWKALHDEHHTAWWVLRGEPEDREDDRPCHELDASLRPKIINHPKAFICTGGM